MNNLKKYFLVIFLSFSLHAMEQATNDRNTVSSETFAEAFKTILLLEFPHDLDKIDPKHLKLPPALTDNRAYNQAMYKALPSAALKLNKFLLKFRSLFKSLMLVDKQTYTMLKDFINDHILSIHPLYKNRIILLYRIDIPILKSILLTTKLTDLPQELIEIITNMATDYDLTDSKDITDPRSFRSALYRIARVHATNRYFYQARQFSINTLAKKLKLKK